MSAALVIPPADSDAPPRKRFTRAEVQRMTDSGLFVDQRLELIEGDLIDKMGQKPAHAYVIRMLQALLAGLFGPERIQVQLPIEVEEEDRESSLPEPDLAVLHEAKAVFQTRHPLGTELLLVIEVADSTLQHDLSTKRDLYGRAGVGEYWVVDLRRRCLVVHRKLSKGEYQSIDSLSELETASMEGAEASISVAQMLPEKIDQ